MSTDVLCYNYETFLVSSVYFTFKAQRIAIKLKYIYLISIFACKTYNGKEIQNYWQNKIFKNIVKY